MLGFRGEIWRKISLRKRRRRLEDNIKIDAKVIGEDFFGLDSWGK
jgi:hypothetical protein